MSITFLLRKMCLLPALLTHNDQMILAVYRVPMAVKYFTGQKGLSKEPASVNGSAFDRTTVVVEALQF